MSDAKAGIYFLADDKKDVALRILLEKLRGQEKKAVVMVADRQRVAQIDTMLWTYRPKSFLAHGRDGDDFADKQPIWISEKPDNPAGADVLIMLEPMAGVFAGDQKAKQDAFIDRGFNRWIVFVDPDDQGEVSNTRTLCDGWQSLDCPIDAFHQRDGRWYKLDTPADWPVAPDNSERISSQS